MSCELLCIRHSADPLCWRHHERHDWFYCARCLKTFESVEARQSHRERQRCHIKCVRQRCLKYRTFPTSKCAHFAKESDDGVFVWMELFRIYRPDVDVPYPKIQSTPLSRRLARSVELSHQDVSSPATPSRIVPPTPASLRDQTSSAATNVTGGIDLFSPTGTRSRTLHTLAGSLWRHIHTRSPRVSNWIRQLYDLAMGPDQRRAQYTERDHAAPVLELFVQRLWSLAHGEMEKTDEIYAELLTFAQNWLPRSVVVSPLHLSLPEADQVPMQSGFTSLDGVGFQFPANTYQEQPPSTPAVNPMQQYLMTSHSVGGIREPNDPPWTTSRAVAGSSRAAAQMESQRPHIDTVSLSASSYSNMDAANASRSYGTLNSGTEPTSTPGTTSRNLSYSTDPTSIDVVDLLREDDVTVPRPKIS